MPESAFKVNNSANIKCDSRNGEFVGSLGESLQRRKFFGSKIEARGFFIPTDYIYPICYMYLPSFRSDIDTYKWIIIILVIKMQA